MVPDTNENSASNENFIKLRKYIGLFTGNVRGVPEVGTLYRGGKNFQTEIRKHVV